LKPFIYIFYGCLGVFFLNQPLIAQEQWSENITIVEKKIIDHGFQQVSVTLKEDILLITYENRIYRFEPRAISELIKLIEPVKLIPLKTIRIITFNVGLPMVQIDIKKEDLIAFHQGELTGSII